MIDVNHPQNILKTQIKIYSVCILVFLIVFHHITVLAATVEGRLGDLDWCIDTTSYKMTITGTGEMAFAPWRQEWAFKKVKTIEIGNGVSNICDSAFQQCSSLLHVCIPDSVVSIGEHAFEDCTSLDNITIPKSVNYIGSYAFYSCPSLHIEFLHKSGDPFMSGDQLFHENCIVYCYKDSIIYDWALENEYKLIYDNLFGKCGSNLFWALDDNGCLTISGTGSMESLPPWHVNSIIRELVHRVVINNGATTIGTYAFDDCVNLISVSIPNTVTYIGQFAFDNCVNLTNLYIPESVTYIAESAFKNCSHLVNIAGMESVKTISSSAFAKCINLSSINIPTSIISIKAFAFCGCISLKNVSIPAINSCIVEKNSFSDCTSLTTVSVSACVTQIGDYAFRNCTNLSSIYFSHGLDESIFFGIEPFRKECLLYCHIHTGVEYWAKNHGYNIICRDLSGLCGPDLIWNLDAHGNLTISGTGEMTSVPWAEANSYVYNVLINEDVTSICDSAFDRCFYLKSISIPDTVSTIGQSAFSFCHQLKSIFIPNNVTTIGDRLFYDCFSLSDVYIPEGVSYIGNYAFYNCSNLSNINIPESVIDIGNYAFYGCKNLDGITIPNGVSTIKDHTFYGCERLISFSIPENITSIGAEAFRGCTNLIGISIPIKVTSINDCAFCDCTNLLSAIIWHHDENPLTLGNSIFNKSCIIYCYEFSNVDGWATKNSYSVKYLDCLDIDKTRIVKLPESFQIDCGSVKRLSVGVFPSYDQPTIKWISSNPKIISVDDGVVTALAPGVATITAAVGSVSDSISITSYKLADDFLLSDDEVFLIAKDSYQLSVSPIPVGASVSITWDSSDTSLANVNVNGLVTTYKPGDVTITAKSSNDIIKQCLIHLCYPVTAIEFESISKPITPNKTLQLKANINMRTQTCINHLVSFSSSNESVAIVDDTGLVLAIHPGKTIITATAASGVTASIDLTVQPHLRFGPPDFILPSSLISIQPFAFRGISAHKIEIPVASNGTTQSIGAYAFADCKNLKEVRIPKNCAIDENAFAGCNDLILFSSKGSTAEVFAQTHENCTFEEDISE